MSDRCIWEVGWRERGLRIWVTAGIKQVLGDLRRFSSREKKPEVKASVVLSEGPPRIQ